jgi:hypothetical protein
VEAHIPLVARLVVLRPGSCEGRLRALLISLKFLRSDEAWIGIPGKTRKLDEVQK